MRSALIGAVESSAVTLRALVRHGHAPLAVVTIPRASAGRHSDYVDLRPLARDAEIPVLETAQVNASEIADALRLLDLDYLFVVGWSQILHPELLAVAKLGSIGLHPAPLPELRGRAVIPWTILLGRRTTGTSLFLMDEGVDSGDILAQEIFDVAEDESAASLIEKHLAALDRMLDSMIPALANGFVPGHPQDHSRASYCAKRTPADGLIDWMRGAREIWTFIRAVGEPYPGAFTYARGRQLVVWTAELVPEAPYFGIPGQVQALGPYGALVACGDGFVRLQLVQIEDGPRVAAGEVLKIHERLGVDLVTVWRAAGGHK